MFKVRSIGLSIENIRIPNCEWSEPTTVQLQSGSAVDAARSCTYVIILCAIVSEWQLQLAPACLVARSLDEPRRPPCHARSAFTRPRETFRMPPFMLQRTIRSAVEGGDNGARLDLRLRCCNRVAAERKFNTD